MRLAVATVFMWACCCAGSAAAELEIRMTGIEGELLENAREALTLSAYEERDPSPAQIRLMYSSAVEEIRTALRPFGYYRASVSDELREPQTEQYVAVFAIDPGDPVTISDVHVEVNGPGARIAAVRGALAEFAPSEGERLVHSAYENSKERVSRALRAAGFLDAETLRSRVAVRLETNTARIEVVWSSGPRYRFGAVHFDEAPLSEQLLRGYVPWRQGDPYSADLILLLQRRLTESEYFTVVSVRPELQHAAAGQVPIEVALIPNERNLYVAGLYWNTDTGPGGRLSFERRWLNAQGHKVEGSLAYSQRLQNAGANYRIPQPGPYNRDYLFGAEYRDEDTDSSRSQTTTLAAAEARERWRGFNRTLGVQYMDSDFEIASERVSSGVLYADAALTRRRVDDVLYPRDSYAVAFGLRASPGELLSDTDFAQVHAQGKWVRGIAPDHRVLLRGELGAMTAGDFDLLPPALRFFAGGDRSIRGFDYQAIGESTAGGVIGGRYLAVAGGEYDYFPSGGNWGAALFVDAGDAFIADFDLHVGAGLGVRWRSPVGMIRLDFARAVEGSLAGGWRIHLVMGPDL